MEDFLEFEKINKLNIPIHSEFDYYIKTLSLSSEFSDIYDKIKAFEDLEEFSHSKGYKNAKSYKLDYALPTLKSYIEKTEAYKLFNGHDYSKEKFRTKDLLLNDLEYVFLSIDFKKANYSILKTFDKNNELYKNWDELCNKMSIHPAIRDSKSFRQYLFGNLNPSRATKLQHIKMLKLIEILQEKSILSESDIVFISHDEFIIKMINKSSEHKNAVVKRMFNFLSKDISKICDEENIPSVSFTVFELDIIGSKIYKKSIYDENFSLKYETLMSCPANKFFKYFKKFILCGDIDKRDLMFMMDNEVAIWKEGIDEVDVSFVPSGEFTMEQLKILYPELYDKIAHEVSGLSKGQIRKILSVFDNYLKIENKI